MQSRAELEEVPPNAVDDNVAVEMPAAVARVGTASVPTYGLRATIYRLCIAVSTSRSKYKYVPPS